MIELNRILLTSFTILCLIPLMFSIESKMSVEAGADVIYVPIEYVTIQEAINHANSGDTIFVQNGIYSESVVVNKSISLVGEDRDLTVIDGNRTGNVVLITNDNVSITGFTIRRSGRGQNDCGIFVEHSNNINISYNTITDNKYGIILGFSSSNVFLGNTVSSNDNDGFSLYFSNRNQFFGNTVSSNDNDGFSLDFSSLNVFLRNTITNNDYGIHFDSYSKDNAIYYNNFLGPTRVRSDSRNFWDDGDEGNHWSDYTGQDQNGDGIGDTPYLIPIENQDNHPLMGLFSNYEVVFEKKTYYVTTICNSTVSAFIFEIDPETGNKVIRLNVTSIDDEAGFCRIKIPSALMDFPYVVLVDQESISPTFPNDGNEILYFTYTSGSHEITIVSSELRHLYYELVNDYEELQTDLYNLDLAYQNLLNSYSVLIGNYSRLQEDHRELNNTYQEHLLNYSRNVRNIQNLTYILAATTAIFIVTAIYISKHAHADKTEVFRRN